MPTPSTKYLEKVGEFVYAVANLEWEIVGDGRLAMASIDQVDLLGSSTGQIARKLRAAIAGLGARPHTQHFISVAADALDDIAPRRNAVLHARPYRNDDGESLLLRLRRGADGEPERFWITFKHLDAQLEIVDGWTEKIRQARRGPFDLD